MKKLILALFGLLVLSGSLFAKEFDKSVGVDFSFNGISPNFYMVGKHFEFQSGLSYMQTSQVLEFDNQAFITSVCAGYTSEIFNTNIRFAIGLDDTFVFGFKPGTFNTGNLFSIYLRLSKPLDNRLELGGKLYIPMHYINVSTEGDQYRNMLPSPELLEKTTGLFTFEVRYYLGGL